jgi:hypothetical protein
MADPGPPPGERVRMHPALGCELAGRQAGGLVFVNQRLPARGGGSGRGHAGPPEGVEANVTRGALPGQHSWQRGYVDLTATTDVLNPTTSGLTATAVVLTATTLVLTAATVVLTLAPTLTARSRPAPRPPSGRSCRADRTPCANRPRPRDLFCGRHRRRPWRVAVRRPARPGEAHQPPARYARCSGTERITSSGRRRDVDQRPLAATCASKPPAPPPSRTRPSKLAPPPGGSLDGGG